MELRYYWDNLKLDWRIRANCPEVEASITFLDTEECCDFVYVQDIAGYTKGYSKTKDKNVTPIKVIQNL